MPKEISEGNPKNKIVNKSRDESQKEYRDENLYGSTVISFCTVIWIERTILNIVLLNRILLYEPQSIYFL